MNNFDKLRSLVRDLRSRGHVSNDGYSAILSELSLIETSGSAVTDRFPQSQDQVSIQSLLEQWDLFYKDVVKGTWMKGQTTHHTMSREDGRADYHIASFRHADDAAFVDFAHNHGPALIAELRRLQSRVQDLESNPLEAGLKTAISLIQKRRDNFVDTWGHVDPDTNSVEFGSGPQAQLREEYVGELQELEDLLRAAIPAK